MNIPSFNPERNYLVYILDMLEAMDRIKEYTSGQDEVAFSQDIQLQDAVVHRVQIIGEAASKIPQEIRSQFPKIQWKDIVAMRNLIIHDYSSVNEGEVWRVVIKDIPILKSQLEKVKVSLKQER